LYGSYARGDYDDESDIDVMILADMTDDEIRKKRLDIIGLKCEIDDKYNVFLSPMAKDIKHFDEWAPFLPFYKNVNDEGILWYG
jgi:predicted nucleotidyltransferase